MIDWYKGLSRKFLNGREKNVVSVDIRCASATMKVLKFLYGGN